MKKEAISSSEGAPDLEPFFKNHPFKDFFGDDFVDKFFGNSPRREFKQRSLGSGFVIDRWRHVLTNYHVVAKARRVYVTLPDQHRLVARVIERALSWSWFW